MHRRLTTQRIYAGFQDQVRDAMATHRSSLMKRLLCVGIVMAMMLLLLDVAAAHDPHSVAGLTQHAYLRGNTNVSGTKKRAVVTEEIHVDDSNFDSMFWNDYPEPSANCKTKMECPPKKRRHARHP